MPSITHTEQPSAPRLCGEQPDGLPSTAIRWQLESLRSRDPLGMSDEDQLVEATADAIAYRTVLQAALHVLAAHEIELGRLNKKHCRVVDEYRAYRARVMAADAQRDAT